jgi:hypothetical protein
VFLIKRKEFGMTFTVTQIMVAALSQVSDSAFQRAAAALGQGQVALREAMQKKVFGKILAAINKLSVGEKLSAEEIKLVRTWIIGDAESYLAAEDDFNEWIEEYKRLIGVLEGFENKECSEQELAMLGGILEDAIRVSHDIAYFLEKKERVVKFDKSLSDGIDENEKEILVRVLSGKLRSAEY